MNSNSVLSTPSKPVTEKFLSDVLLTYGIPSLESFARRVLFKDLGLCVPHWDVIALRQNLTMSAQYRQLMSDHDKLVQRILRKESDLSAAIADHVYMTSKLKDLELAIDEDDLGYVRTSLQDLQRRQTRVVEQFQYFINLAQV